MTLDELKKFIGEIPNTYGDYEIVNGEIGYIDMNDGNTLSYRVDKPIIALYVDESSKEICFFHQTKEDIRDFYKEINTNDNTNNDTTENPI